jgi:hypothetical protein
MSFIRNKPIGDIGEKLAGNYIQSRGGIIQRIGKTDEERFQGPRLRGADGDEPSPDIIAFNTWLMPGGAMWVEVKHKSVFSWRRTERCWQTGIDRSSYEHYKRVALRTKTPVWLLFFHRESTPSPADRAWGCPAQCPVGLFGDDMMKLIDSVEHADHRWGKSGMVYWNHRDLTRIASRADVLAVSYPEMFSGRPPLLGEISL